MKIAIQKNLGSFSDDWIDYCEANNIPYKLVNCYSNDIIEQISDCDALMWHFSHLDPKASKFAKQLLYSIQTMGKTVFPDYNTIWHFDDKIGQKYLLEAIGAPLAKTYVFYDKNIALNWAHNTDYPKVFKLRSGAGSENVKLITTSLAAKRIIRRAFGNGFMQYRAWINLKYRILKFRAGNTTFWDVLKGFVRLIIKTEYSRLSGKEIGYAYFQDFIPDNTFDIRVVVIGDKAFAIKRMVRENDFRASGSGHIYYEKHNFDEKTIRLSFDIADKLSAQCLAYDFVYQYEKPILVEISYGYSKEGYYDCEGFWDRKLNWHPGKIKPQNWMVELILNSIPK